MNKSTKLSFLTSLSLFPKLLAYISLVLVGMIKPFKCCMRERTIFSATSSSFLIILFTLLRLIVKFVRRSSMVKWLVRINTMIPIMIFRLVSTKGSLVSEDIEDNWVDSFQIFFESFLEGIWDAINTNLFEIQTHRINVKSLKLSLTYLTWSWQKRWIIQYAWYRRCWIVSSLFFINTSETFKVFRKKILKYWRCCFSLKSYYQWPKKVLFAVLFNRKRIWIFWKLIALAFQTQNLQF